MLEADRKDGISGVFGLDIRSRELVQAEERAALLCARKKAV